MVHWAAKVGQMTYRHSAWRDCARMLRLCISETATRVEPANLIQWGKLGMKEFAYIPLVAGIIAWLIGGSIILSRAARREGLRWPTRPPLTKLTVPEFLAYIFLLLLAFGGYALTAALRVP